MSQNYLICAASRFNGHDFIDFIRIFVYVRSFVSMKQPLMTEKSDCESLTGRTF